MKKQASKITAILLAALLLFCITPTAYAAETASAERVAIGSFTSGTVTINATNADDSFALYKVVDITYDSVTNTVSYDFTASVKAFIAASATYSSLTIDSYRGWADDSAELKAFLGAYAVYVKATPVTADKTAAAAGGTATINGLALGQYMILGTGSSTGAYIYQIMTASFKPDSALNVNTGVTVASKATTPTIEKKVNGEDADTAAAGDTVTYTLTIGIPTYPAEATNRTFVVTDTLPDGLTFAATTSIKAGTAEITATEAENAQLHSWAFDFANIAAYESVTITYTATVNDDAVVGTAGNINTAVLEYSNDPFGTGTHEISDSSTVYTYGIKVLKVEKDKEEVKLKGVEFDVYVGTDTSVETGTKLGTIVTDENGVAELSGLDVGTYTLVETKTATGYAIDNTPIEITITDAEPDGAVDADADAANSGYVAKTITNVRSDINLPQTGGIGTWVFTVAGVAIMLAAVCLFVVYRRKSESK